MRIVNLFWGIFSLSVGIFFLFYIIKKRQEGDKGGYGAHIKMLFGAIVFIAIGLKIIIDILFK